MRFSWLNPRSLLALAVAAGIVALSADALLRGGLTRNTAIAAFANAGVIVVYTLVDGLGARAAGSGPVRGAPGDTYGRNFMRHADSSDTPAMTSPNIGASRCQPIPAPAGYSVTSASPKSSAPMAAHDAARARHGSSHAGIGRAGAPRRAPSPYVRP